MTSNKYGYTAVVPVPPGPLTPSRRVRLALAALRHVEDAAEALRPFLQSQITPEMQTRRIVLEEDEWTFVDELLHRLSLPNRSVLIRALLRYYDQVLLNVNENHNE